MAEEFVYRVPIQGGTIKLTSPVELSEEQQQKNAQEAVRSHLAAQTQSTGWGSSVDQGLQWLRDKVDQGARRVDTMVGLGDPGKGVLEHVNPIPSSTQGLAGLLTSIAAPSLLRGGGVGSALARAASVPASEAIVGSMQPQGIDATGLMVDTGMNALPDAVGQGMRFKNKWSAGRATPQDLADLAAADNALAGPNMPRLIADANHRSEVYVPGRQEGSWQAQNEANYAGAVDAIPKMAAVDGPLAPQPSMGPSRVNANPTIPVVTVPSLVPQGHQGELRLDVALARVRELSQKIDWGKTHDSPEMMDWVRQRRESLNEIDQSLRRRDMPGVADAIKDMNQQYAVNASLREINAGTGQMGQPGPNPRDGGTPGASTFTEKGGVNMRQLHKNLLTAIDSRGEMTIDPSAIDMINNAYRRGASGMSSTDIPGSLPRLYGREGASGVGGVSAGLHGMAMPQRIGDPNRFPMPAAATGRYNPLSVFLGQILQNSAQ